MATKQKVLIVGAGFAGLGAMRKLRKAPVEVTLVDKNDYHTFLPLLYQVATAELSPDEVAFPARELLHGQSGWRFHRGAVTGISLDRKTVSVEGFGDLPYDYLILGTGAVPNYFGTPGAAEHAFPLYSMDDAVNLKTHILELFEKVDAKPSLVDEGALNFCIVGGGATGVEVAGALAELLQAEIKHDYPNLPIDRAEVHLFELGPALLGPFKSKLQDYAKKTLEDRGVRVHLGEGVASIEPDRVRLKSGKEMTSRTLIWAAGLRANPLAEALGQPLEKGRVVVGPALNLPAHPEVFVIGDIAMITDTKTGQKLPQLGSVAQQAGFTVGENITRMAAGKETEPFEYEDKGTMATIGRGAAVVEFHSGRTLTGRAAWVAWLGVHLTLLSGGEEKGIALLDWGWNIVSQDRSKRILVG